MRTQPHPAEWARLTHEELYAQVRTGPGSAAALAAQDLWTGAGTVLESGHARVTAALATSGEGWTGTAADAARGGLSPLTEWALAAVDDAGVTVKAVVAQGDHAERLRTLMPAPNTADVRTAQAAVDAASPRFGPVTQTARLVDAQAQAHALADDAFRLMRGYADSSDGNAVNLDRWSVPPAVTVDAAPIGRAAAVAVRTSPAAGRVGAAAGIGPAGVAESPAATAAGLTGPVLAPSGAARAGAAPGAPATGPVPAAVGGAAALMPGYGGRGSSPDPTGSGGTGGGAGDTGSGRTGGGAVPQSLGSVPGTSPLGAVGRAATSPRGAAEQPYGRAGTGELRPGGPAGSTAGRPGVISSIGGTGEPAARTLRPGTLGGGGEAGWAGRYPATPGPGGEPGSTRWSAPGGVGGEAGSTGRSAGTVGLGGEAESTARRPAELRPGVIGGSTAAEPASAARGSSHGGFYPPMMGGSSGGQDGGHRRPDWLVDDSGAFEDHRWFPPAVIGPDDPLPPAAPQ